MAESSEHWKIEKGLCRCCHSEGSFHQLSDICIVGEEEGFYADMLQLTLNISMKPVEKPLNMICDNCVHRVKDATAFKQQVLRCEAQFHEMYTKGVIKVGLTSVVKEEPESDGNDDSKMDVGGFEDNDEANTDVADSQSEPLAEVGLELCKKEPLTEDTDNRRKSLRTKKATSILEISLLTPKQQKPKQKPKPSKKLKKTKDASAAEDSTSKGSMPAFRLADEDYWQDGGLYRCARCEKTYDKLFSLKFHVKYKHYKIPRYSCSYCAAKFMTPAPLTIHKLQEHNIDERFKCNACKGTFNTKIQLRKHINNFHMLGEKHKCQLCDYESFSFEGMYKHKFKHKTVKDYHCRFCRKSFLRKTTLDLHERIHTGDRRKVCAVCGQAFVQKASLNYHMTKYHPEVNF